MDFTRKNKIFNFIEQMSRILPWKKAKMCGRICLAKSIKNPLIWFILPSLLIG